jgi:ferredoxin
MAQAQAMLEGLGYAKPGQLPVQWVHATQALELDAELQRLTTGQQRLRSAVPAATFAVMADKRSTLSMVIDHLLEHAPVLKAAAAPEALALPKDGSLFGSVEVNKDSCTLCMSCVSACPANALQDNQAAPQLRFFEKNCVQCGLCVSTCPEKALNLVPRLLLTPQRKEVRVLNETQPYGCVRCGKPFGTLKGIEAMINSMTPEERRNPDIINPSRKTRIAKGSGKDITEVNQFLKQFEQMKNMMKMMNKMPAGRMPMFGK